VRFDVRPVGDPGGVAGRLQPRDVALDPVEVDDDGRRAEFGGRCLGEAGPCGLDRRAANL
jgi:hypothetical protein